jgi:Zn-dependent peptidase ImmA (M78 family)
MFRRGFKSWCEEVSCSVRREQGLRDVDPLLPSALAASLGALLVPVEEVRGVPADVRLRLVRDHRDGWSAITVSASGRTLVVFNSGHSAARRSSDLMHELAHVLLRHVPRRSFVDPTRNLLLRTFDADQEEEAGWLAACLLLPRGALLLARASGWSNDAVCRRYGVSADLLRFRVNVTGVDRQVTRVRRRAGVRPRGI